MQTFDITKTGSPVTFTIGTEDFEAIPADDVSVGVMADYFQTVSEGDLFKAHEEFFKVALTPDSLKRFNKRLRDKVNPITISLLGDITSWLLGEYLGGKSFGRGQAIITFALDIWDEFDSWCLIHGINDPWNLPSYRFGALVVAYMKDDKVPEGIEAIDSSLRDADSIPHPFLAATFRRNLKAMSEILSAPKTSTTIDNVVYDSRLTDLPIEEQKRRKAAAKGKPYRIPEWWVGERQAYKVASSMMKVLPKKMGKPVT